MANLLHRLLRGRHAREAPDAPAPIERVAEAPEPEPPPTEEPAPAASKPEEKPAGRGPRKTRDEVSSIGPGEPA